MSVFAFFRIPQTRIIPKFPGGLIRGSKPLKITIKTDHREEWNYYVFIYINIINNLIFTV